MKKIYVLLSLLVSFNAFAGNCPEISGNYSCQQGSHVSLKEIVKTATGYKINSDGIDFEYFTDGNVYEVEANENMKDGKVSSLCDNNKFIVNFNATVLYEGSELAKQVSRSEYYINNGTLLITQKTKMKGIPLPTVKFTCSIN